MKISKVKTLAGIATIVALLTGCASNYVETSERVPTESENPSAEPEKLTVTAACQKLDSDTDLINEFLRILLKEVKDSSPRQSRIARLGAEIVEASQPIVEVRVEDEAVEKEIVKFGNDMATLGQTFVDGYDFFEDIEPLDALEELEISVRRAQAVCGEF